MKLIDLFEVSMSPASLEAQGKALLNNVKVGYEFEFAVSSNSPLFGFSIEKSGVLSVRDIKNLDQLYQHFYFTKSEGEKRIFDFYVSDYAGKQAKIFAEENWEDFYDETDEEKSEDQREEEAKQSAYEAALISLKDDFYIDDFISSHAKDIIDYLNLEPTHDWYDKKRGIFYTGKPTRNRYKTFKKIEASLSQIFSPVEIETRATNVWTITTDESISDDDDDEIVGVEIISPPLPLLESIQALKQMFAWMNDNKVITNKSTGLHINVSVKNIKDLDPVKLVLFIGEQYVAKQFERTMNKYAQLQVQRLAKAATFPDDPNEIIQPTADNIKNIIQYLNMHLSVEKYYSVNLSKTKQGYVEFRMAGNKDYHKDFEKAKNTTLRFVTALAIACDKEAYKKEYYKKIVQLFNKSLKDIGWKTTPEKHYYDWEYIKQKSGFQWFRTGLRNFQREVENNNKRDTLIILFHLIYDMFYEFEKFNKKDIMFVYSLMRLAKISKKELADKILKSSRLDEDEQEKIIRMLNLNT